MSAPGEFAGASQEDRALLRLAAQVELYGAYPELADVLLSCQPGWYPTVGGAVGLLRRTYDPVPVVTDVREKFGGLRISLDTYPDGVVELLADVEDRSYEVCECCGAHPALLRPAIGWLRTLCDVCTEASR